MRAYFLDMEKTKPIVYIAFITAMLLWSFSFIWSKQAFEVYGVYTVLVGRLSIAAVTLLVVSKLAGVLQKVEKKDYYLLILLSFFEPFLYFMGESNGLKHVSSTMAAVMIALIPLGMPFIGKKFFDEKISLYNIIGLSASIIGVMMIIINKEFSLDASPKGIGFLLIAVFAALGYTVVLKQVTKKYNAFTIVSWQNVFAIIGFIPWFIAVDLQDTFATGFSKDGVLYIVLLALFASNGAFLLYTYGLKHLGVAKAGVFTNLIPIFTAIISFIVFKEQLSPVKYIGIVVVVAGLMISQINSKSAAH